MKLRSGFAVVVAGLGVVGLGGCRTPEPAGPSPVGEPGPAVLVTGPLAPEPLETLAEPMRADAKSVEVVGRVELLEWPATGPREHRRLVVERSSPTGAGATWQVTRTVLERIGGGADEATPVLTETYALMPDGAVAIIEENNHDEKVEVVFDPPMVVMPRELAPGTPFEQTFGVQVFPGGKGRKILKSSGTATQTIELTGVWKVTLAEGQTVEARGVRSVFRADFSPAKVVNTTEQWFVDGVGVVAERKHERTTVFGAAIRESLEMWGARSVDRR